MATWTYNQGGETYDDAGALWDGLDPNGVVTVLVGTPSSASAISRVKLDTIVATDNATSGSGILQFTIQQALSALTTVKDQAMVRIVDHVLHTETHRAFIRSRKPITGIEPQVEIVADDIGVLLHDTYIPLEARPAETMQARIIALWFFYRPNFLDNATTHIASIGSTLAAQTFAGVTLYQAIEATVMQASSTAKFHVDSLGKLHVYTSESNSAPYDVIVGTPGSDLAPEDFSVEYETMSYYNRVYVQGATPEASGFFQDDAAIAATGLIRETALQASDCTALTMSEAVADSFFAAQATAVLRGRFVTRSPKDGWQSGQNVTVTEPDIPLSGVTFQIQSVTTRYQPSGTGAGFVREYEVEFGGRSNASPGDQAAATASGQLVYGNLGAEGRVFVTSDGVTVTDGT